jgi:hypothetical protein
MSKKPAPEQLESIDPTALAQVSGGASGGANSEVMTALQGVLDSVNSLKGQQSGGGMDPMTMMMMMMMMGGGRQQGPVVAAPANTIGGYAGYTIDGVYYPFYK